MNIWPELYKLNLVDVGFQIIDACKWYQFAIDGKDTPLSLRITNLISAISELVKES